MSQSKHIAVLGAGSMGNGITQIFAAKGHEVTLFDHSETILEAAIGKIESDLVFLSRDGFDPGKDIHPAIERIKLSANLQEAIKGARFVVETSEDNLKMKQSTFREIEAYCSSVTILATHTSRLGISDIAARMKVKERVVGTRFWFPPYLIPLVEVMGSRDTLPEVKSYVCNLLLSVGMRPVLIDKEVSGFISHRLLEALRREALSIVNQAIAAPDTVDEVVKAGLGFRLSALGLHQKEDEDMVLNDRRWVELVRQLIDWSREIYSQTPQRIEQYSTQNR